ncbi:MAG: DUF4188 domain-containing protein [Sandaracinaceae bacterium]
MTLRNERLTALYDKPFVVFLIGMRINRWWRIDLWLPVAFAMVRMLKELEANKEAGLLGWEGGGLGNPNLMVQYWESSEKLMEYARSKESAHFPAWSAFNKKVAETDAVGIWHETYEVAPLAFESVYNRMPPFGMGKVGQLVSATGELATAQRRLRRAAAKAA